MEHKVRDIEAQIVQIKRELMTPTPTPKSFLGGLQKCPEIVADFTNSSIT